MKYSIFTIIILTCWSCTTLKPNSSGVNKYDINKRIEIQNPTYYSELNGLGVGSIIAGTIGGAYAGYQSKAIQYNRDVEQKTLDVGNIIIGAVVGYTFSYYGNRLLGWGKTKKAPDYTKWLYKVNPDYTLLNHNQPNVIRAIHNSAESNFTVNKLSDAHDFAQAFKNSSYTDKLIDQTLSNKTLLRSDFSDMAQTFAKANNSVKLKKEYILRSDNVTELFEGVAKYPTIISEQEIQLKSSDLIANMLDFKKYKARFTGVEYDDKIFSNIYENLSNEDLAFLIKQYPKSTDIHEAKVLLISKTESISTLKLLLTEYGRKYQDNVEQKAEKLVLDDRTQFTNFISNFPNARRLLNKGNNYYLGNSNSKRQPEGTGISWNKTESMYKIGTFKAGKLSGENCEIDKPNYSYKGAMVDGEKSGKGKEINTGEGYTYDGGFKGDDFFEKGVFRGKLGSIFQQSGTGLYTGDFKNGVASGQGKLQIDGKTDWYEGGVKDGLYDGIGTFLSIREETLYETGSGNRTSIVNRQTQGMWKDGKPNGKFKFFCILREDVAWGILGDLTNKQKVPISVEGNAYSWDELSRLENEFIQKVNGKNGDIKSSITQQNREYSRERETKEKRETEKEQEEEETKKREREEEKYQEEDQKAREGFIESISFKDMGTTKLGIGYNGECPCNDLKLIKENGLWKSNDAFHIYKDKNDHYYFYNSWPMTDKGPYSLERIKEIIYEENYKPKKK
jgi:hypothetical protein